MRNYFYENQIIEEYKEKDEIATKGFVREQIRKIEDERSWWSVYAPAGETSSSSSQKSFLELGTPSIRGLLSMLIINFALWILFLWWIEQTLSHHGLS